MLLVVFSPEFKMHFLAFPITSNPNFSISKKTQQVMNVFGKVQGNLFVLVNIFVVFVGSWH